MWMQGVGDGVDHYYGKVSNDDTYQVDTTYRLLADHLRMISISTIYYAQPGKCVHYRLVVNVNSYRINMTFILFLIMNTSWLRNNLSRLYMINVFWHSYFSKKKHYLFLYLYQDYKLKIENIF